MIININITLGDNVDLQKIMNSLCENGIIELSNKDNKYIHYTIIPTTPQPVINIKMCGKDKNDTFSKKVHDEHYKQDVPAILYDIARSRLDLCSKESNYSNVYNDYIESGDKRNIYRLPHFCLQKDTNGNLSLFKDCEDGNVIYTQQG